MKKKEIRFSIPDGIWELWVKYMGLRERDPRLLADSPSPSVFARYAFLEALVDAIEELETT